MPLAAMGRAADPGALSNNDNPPGLPLVFLAKLNVIMCSICREGRILIEGPAEARTFLRYAFHAIDSA